MINTIRNTRAFTLVELLVVITIIGILAGVGFSAYNTAQERAKQNKSLQYAKQMGISLKTAAGDFDGLFPRWNDLDTQTDATNANEVFSTLISDYGLNEEMFFVQGSAYSDTPVDNDGTLDEGENAYMYFAGLIDTDPGRWPLVASGAADSSGTYAESRSDPGGVWRGQKAIVVRVDMSGAIENLNSDFQLTENVDGSQQNILTPSGTWLDGPDVEVLLPE